MKSILAVIFLSCATFTQAAFAQNEAAIAKARAACGPGEIHFNVEAENFSDSVDQPAGGKALVYVIAEGPITSRIGLNGAWVGAIVGNSHLSFSIDREITICVLAGNLFS